MEAVKSFTGLASDSREVKPGYLFAALPGTRADGARFLKDAVTRGARAVMGRPDIAPAAKALGVRVHRRRQSAPRRSRATRRRFFGAQPAMVAAVTGTKGKTSIAVFVREIWTALGRPAASLGTVGLVAPKGEIALKHTTPDPIEIHRLLAQMAKEGIDHLALEASSHGLAQYRLDGVDIAAVAFTNITRDHMDYHPTFEDYLTAKLRLFTEVVRDGGVAVVNADAAHADRFIAAAAARGLKLADRRRDRRGHQARRPQGPQRRPDPGHRPRRHDIYYRPAARRQLPGVQCAGRRRPRRSVSARIPPGVLRAGASAKGAPGRLEKVAFAASGAPIYVDYAHTPDSLEKVLNAIRPHISGKLHVVFGCGGDRDKGKRPLMGKAAHDFADDVIVTDDNPRSEDASLRSASEALAGAPGAREIGDRAEAIRDGIAALGDGDILVIAGKGHETGQIVGNETRPFSDRDEAIKAALALGGRGVERAV